MDDKMLVVITILISMLINNICFSFRGELNAHTNDSNVISIEPLINMSFVSGIVRLTVFSQKPYVEVYVNSSLYGVYSNAFTIEFNTENWIDGLYIIDFIAYDDNQRLSTKLIWFVDNNPPLAELKLPVLTIGMRPWINGSIAPVMDPVLLDESNYVKNIGNYTYYVLYIKGVDKWIDRSILYLNDTIAEVYYRERVVEGVFSSNISALVYVKIPSSGLYYIKYEVRDLSGKSNYSVLKAIFDLDKPTLIIEKPINKTITNNTTVSFKLIPMDKTSKICITNFYVTTSSEVKPAITRYIPIPGRFVSPPNETASFNLTFAKSATYYVWFLVLDEALNYHVDFVVVTVDNIPPVIKHDHEVQGNKLFVKVFVHENITDVERVEIYLNDSLITVTRNKKIEINTSLPTGYHFIKIRAFDTAGNEASSTLAVFINESTVSLHKIISNREFTRPYPALLLIIMVGAIVAIAIFVIYVIFKNKR